MRIFHNCFVPRVASFEEHNPFLSTVLEHGQARCDGCLVQRCKFDVVVCSVKMLHGNLLSTSSLTCMTLNLRVQGSIVRQLV